MLTFIESNYDEGMPPINRIFVYNCYLMYVLQVVPHCTKCPDIPLAIMKPDIVFFGENLPEVFHRAMKQDKDEVDLLIVIGSSLKVRPVALIPSMFCLEEYVLVFCRILFVLNLFDT